MISKTPRTFVNFNKSYHPYLTRKNTFFWEEIRRFYQALKGAHVTKKG